MVLLQVNLLAVHPALLVKGRVVLIPVVRLVLTHVMFAKKSPHPAKRLEVIGIVLRAQS